jgi:hypothetical protein
MLDATILHLPGWQRCRWQRRAEQRGAKRRERGQKAQQRGQKDQQRYQKSQQHGHKAQQRGQKAQHGLNKATRRHGEHSSTHPCEAHNGDRHLRTLMGSTV